MFVYYASILFNGSEVLSGARKGISLRRQGKWGIRIDRKEI